MTLMTSLEFEYDLAMVRRLTPDFIPCRAERREHFFTGYWAYLSLQFPLPHVLLPRNKQYTGEHRHAAADAQGAARPTPPQLASIIVDLRANPSAIRIFLKPWML